jgi:hypothetical protein
MFPDFWRILVADGLDASKMAWLLSFVGRYVVRVRYGDQHRDLFSWRHCSYPFMIRLFVCMIPDMQVVRGCENPTRHGETGQGK